MRDSVARRTSSSSLPFFTCALSARVDALACATCARSGLIVQQAHLQARLARRLARCPVPICPAPTTPMCSISMHTSEIGASFDLAPFGRSQQEVRVRAERTKRLRPSLCELAAVSGIVASDAFRRIGRLTGSDPWLTRTRAGRGASALHFMSEEMQVSDGRVARRLGNRVRILDALFQLIREGKYHPTLKQIAARAGVTPRTLLNHFPDHGSLVLAAAQHGRRLAESTLPDLPTTGDPERRVRDFFRRASGFYDAFAAIRWSTLTTTSTLPGGDPNKHKSVTWGRLSDRVAMLVSSMSVELSRPVFDKSEGLLAS